MEALPVNAAAVNFATAMSRSTAREIYMNNLDFMPLTYLQLLFSKISFYNKLIGNRLAPIDIIPQLLPD